MGTTILSIFGGICLISSIAVLGFGLILGHKRDKISKQQELGKLFSGEGSNFVFDAEVICVNDGPANVRQMRLTSSMN